MLDVFHVEIDGTFNVYKQTTTTSRRLYCSSSHLTNSDNNKNYLTKRSTVLIEIHSI